MLHTVSVDFNLSSLPRASLARHTPRLLKQASKLASGCYSHISFSQDII